MATEMFCPRDPDVTTRLRCSSCETPICPQCWRDAVVGFHCPDCSEERNRRAAGATPDKGHSPWGLTSRNGAIGRADRDRTDGHGSSVPDQPRGHQGRRTTGDEAGGQPRTSSGAADKGRPNGSRLPFGIGTRAVVIGLSVAVLGGMLLGPVLAGGAFFLISAGVIGWLVARAVFWAADERSTPFVRAAAMTLAGFMVAVGLAVAGASAGVGLLAYPAALWGGWIVVRQR